MNYSGCLVFEPHYTGHHLFYLKLFVEALSSINCSVTWCGSPEAFQEKAYSDDALQIFKRVNFIALPKGRFGTKWVVFDYWRQLRKLIKNRGEGCVLIPYGDGLVYLMAIWSFFEPSIFSKKKISFVLFRAESLFSKARNGFVKTIKKLLIKRLSSNPLVKFFIVDEIAHEGFRKEDFPASRFVFLADPIPPDCLDAELPVETDLSVSLDRKILGVVGELNSRKGVARLIDFFCSQRELSEWLLLLAGKPDAAVAKLMQEERVSKAIQRQRIVYIPRYLSEGEMRAYLSKSSLVSVLYPEHVGPSGILIRAIGLSKPVLGYSNGWIGTMIKNYSLGLNCQDDSFVELKKSLAVFSDSFDFNLMHIGQKRFLEGRQTAVFKTKFSDNFAT